MQIITDPAEMQAIAENLRLQRQLIGVVMTMGALHDGHLSLVRLAQKRAGTVIMTLFVNPLQFGPDEDFERYPRPFEQDAALARSAGVDYLFAPEPGLMYPEEFRCTVDPGPMAGRFEGSARPGHFRGVATVVLKLLNITKAHVAFFGEKDAQQLAIIRRIAADMNIDTRIEAAPIAREPDGLATSSRNIYLSPEEREHAAALYRAIRHAEAETGRGRRDLAAIAKEGLAIVSSAPGAKPDYLCFVDDDTFEPADEAAPGKAYRLVMAVRIGTTRLIDNWRYMCEGNRDT
ncbi:MAG: pantoate--beta-alanine ligase [Chlorobiaceae bacterium]|nr:pantoate--beta-alanine ligase [Chlorobiaceae bacterium]